MPKGALGLVDPAPRENAIRYGYRVGALVRRWARGGSGPRTARIFHSLLALCALDAWLSLGSQIQLLIGSRGLLPIAPLVTSLAAEHDTVWQRFPTFLLLDPSDAAITAGVACGVVLSVLALVGVAPRVSLLLSAPLYLGYAVAGRRFLSFQWDNLLIECLVLASLLPRDRESPGAHWMMRLLLFKLYFESGLAKAGSHLGDWFDGSAMTFYYETAPIPTWVGWWAHQLPELWHHIESWGALGLELGGAVLILGPRKARLVACASLTVFQLLNLGTANYGFFVYLALSLHVFLLDDTDWAAASRRLRRLGDLRPDWAVRPRLRIEPPRVLRRVSRVAGGAFALAWLLGSLGAGLSQFHGPSAVEESLRPIAQFLAPYRVANNYHLFMHITRTRIEPELQTRVGATWRPHHMHYKPGDVTQPPPFVAPHQPRVDFVLWFHGLGYERGAPPYVLALLRRICADPSAVQPLFPEPLPAHPDAARVVYWQYHFTDPEERRRTGAWWRRRLLAEGRALPCSVRQDSGNREE